MATSHRSNVLTAQSDATPVRADNVLRLSAEQRAAAECPARLSRIVAGPGSGKSSVATYRFGLHRFESPDNRAVLGLSFTRAAVRVLNRRISDRWGSAALSWPHRVITIDELHRMTVEHLIASEALEWPMEMTGATIDVVDAWTEEDGAVHVKRRAVYWRAGVEDGLVCVQQFAWTSQYGKALTSRQRLEEHLFKGRCTHDDIRSIVEAALTDVVLRAAVLVWIQQTFRAVVIDEAYDSNGLDVALIRLLAEAGTAITLIGDHWQTLYEFRGATPELLNQTADELGFEEKEIRGSFRFTPELHSVAQSLRHGGVVRRDPIPGPGRVDIVLAHEWETAWDLGSDVLPLAVGGTPKTALDAVLTLILDAFVFEQLRLRAAFKSEAERALRITYGDDGDEPHQAFVHMLRTVAESAVELADIANGIAGHVDAAVLTRVRALAASPGRTRIKGFKRLKERVETVRGTGDVLSVPGITIHQAKGQEWDSVALALKEAGWKALESSLDVNDARHRALYVGMTRARSELSLIKVESPPAQCSWFRVGPS